MSVSRRVLLTGLLLLISPTALAHPGVRDTPTERSGDERSVAGFVAVASADASGGVLYGGAASWSFRWGLRWVGSLSWMTTSS